MSILHKMKALLCMSFLLLIAASQNDYTYSTYMTQFNRTYQKEEKSQHEAIFYSIYQQIIKLRQQGVDVQVNNFTDWNETQKKQFFNYKPDTLDIPSDAPKPAEKYNKVKLASTMSQFDWRKLDRVTEVKNQKNCGSCWAFSSAALYQSLLAKESNGQKYDISQQYIIQCDKSSSGCDGGFPYNALQFIKKSGVPSEQSYPYKTSSTYYNTTLICSAETPENPFIKLQTQLYDIGHYTNISISDLEQFLINNGPISVGIDANHTQFYGAGPSGLISCPASNDVNHAVLLVGFNSSHWFIKNSWGTSWGDLGFGYVSKAMDCNLRRQVDVPFIAAASSPQINTNLLNISVLLTDSYGDGWEGSIIGLKQNGIVVASFGQNFTFGYEKGPFSLQIPNNIETQIVFLQKGSYSSQMGFTISISNQTIYTQNSGTTIASNTIFLTFCPVPGLCAVKQTVTYYMTLKDSYGDGWNGNTFGFKQDGSIIKNFTMSTGRLLGPIAVEIKKFIKVDIVVVVYGSWGEEIGFQLRNGAGYLVANRTAGSKFSATTILGSFCPECVNLVPVPTATQVIEQFRHEQSQQVVDNSLSSYKISTIILAPLCSILMLIILFLSIKLNKTVKNERKAEQAKQQKSQADEKVDTNENLRKKVRKHSSGSSFNSIIEVDRTKNNQHQREDDKYGSSKNIID